MANIYDMVDTWNNGATTFTALKMNVTDTASAAGSLLMDLQVGGVSKEKTSKAGDKTMAGVFNSLSRGSASSLTLGMDTNTNGFYVPATGNIGVVIGTTDAYRMRVADFTIGTALLGWGTNIDSPDLLIGRDAANILAQRNGTAAQTFRLYKSFTDASNFARLDVGFNANGPTIFPGAGGTGSNIGLTIGGGNAASGGLILFTPTNIQFGTDAVGWQVMDAAGIYPVSNGVPTLGKAAVGYKQLFIDYTNTATVGAVTINKAAGRVNIAAAGTSVVVTNSLVTAASHVMVVMSTADATGRVTSVVPAAGSFTINTVATTAQASFDFFVINAD